VKISGALFHTILIVVFTVLQSVVFKHGLIAGVTPDFALIILIFSSSQHGSFKAESSGFVAGLTQDFLSTTPIGFHALSRTLIGYLYGIFKGKLFIDPILVPVLLVAVGTFLKAVLSFFILSIFAQEYSSVVFTRALGVEIGLNALAAPFLFALFKLLGVFKTAREEHG
jgi:rod shape-determining protein MreD